MSLIVVFCERRPQGNKGVDSKWAQAHHHWVVQLLVRLRLETDLSDFLNEDGTVPAYFDRDKLVPLCLDGISWWDEVHKECFIGNYREGSKT
jgi:hypothetical protein